MPKFKSSSRASGRATPSASVNADILLTYHNKKLVSTPVELKPIQRGPPNISPTKTRRDNTETARDHEKATREGTQPNTTDVSSAVLAARAVATSHAQRPLSPTKRPKKRIITPQMVKRRTVNVKNPLVMKSDESHSGKDSVITEHTEKASNRKDAKRRQRGYAAFGKERNNMIGLKKRSGGLDTDRPPLPSVTESASKDSLKENKKRGNKGKGKERLPVLAPIEYKEDALLRTKTESLTIETDAPISLTRDPSTTGQSCSAFFLGDASVSVSSNAKKEKEIMTEKKSRGSKKSPLVKANLPKESTVTDPKSKLPALSNQENSSQASDQENGMVESPSLIEVPTIDTLPTIETAPTIATEVGTEVEDDIEKVDGKDGKDDSGIEENAKKEEIKQIEDAKENEKVSTVTDEKIDVANCQDDQAEDQVNRHVTLEQSGNHADEVQCVHDTTHGKDKPPEKSGSKGGKKKQMTMASFLGKQSKVIDENTEYVEKNLTMDSEVMNQDKYLGLQDQASDEIMDIHLQVTLSDCEFSSVQSSVTTDKILETQPSIIKRTSSLIRNPLLLRKRSKEKSNMDELIRCMKNGKLAAKADNKKDEMFDEKTARGKTKSMIKLHHPDSDEIEEMYDFNDGNTSSKNPPSEKDSSLLESTDDSPQYLTSRKTFDDGLAKHSVNIPEVDTSAKIDVKSPSFRLSAVSGSGAGLHSPVAQQMLLNTLNRNTSLGIQTENRNTINAAPSLDNGTQTSPTASDGMSYTYGFNTKSCQPNTPSIGTFGDVIETIGLFSARICLGTGAAIVSCSRACNDNPKSDVRQVSLNSNSFVIPDVNGLSPRNAGVLSPTNALSPRNNIFRDGPVSPSSPSNAYVQALADAISVMPEEEQIRLVRSLTPKSVDMDDMVSSVDGAFRRGGMSARMKKVPHNIAVKPKPKHVRQDEATKPHKAIHAVGTNAAKPKKPLRGFRKGIKRLANTRLTVMYQV